MAGAASPWKTVDEGAGAASLWKPVDEAPTSVIGDVAKGAWSKLNPLEMIKGMSETAKALGEHPVDTALSVLAHPYNALKRAKEAIDAGKPEEALAHIQSAITPGGFMTEGSAVKAATPGKRAEGFGELLGTGLGAYLTAKVPDMAGAVKGAPGAAMDALESTPAGAALRAAVKNVKIPFVHDLVTAPAKAGFNAYRDFQAQQAIDEIPMRVTPPPLPQASAPSPYFTGGATGGVIAPPAIPGASPAAIGPTPPISGALPATAEAATALPVADTAALDEIAQSLAGKKFARLDPRAQQTVRNIAAKDQARAPSPAAAPAPAQAAAPEAAAPDTSSPVNTSAVETIPFSKPDAPAEVFKGPARTAKARALAHVLDQSGISADDLGNVSTKVLTDPTTPQGALLSQLIKRLNINQTGEISAHSVGETLFELRKLQAAPKVAQ